MDPKLLKSIVCGFLFQDGHVHALLQEGIAEAKKEGNTDEKVTNATNNTLFKFLFEWDVTEGNLFVWCFALLLWNLMASSVNVYCMFLHNVKFGIPDSIVFEYDKTQIDKTSELVQGKLIIRSFEGSRALLLVYYSWCLFACELRVFLFHWKTLY